MKLGQDCPEVDCTITAELTDDQIAICLDDAFLWWSSYRGLYREATLSIVANQSEYDLSSMTPGVEKVLNIVPPRENWRVDMSSLYPGFLDVHLIPYGMIGTVAGMYPQTTISQTVMTMKTNEYVLGTDFTWDFYYENIDDTEKIRTLRIMPPSQSTGTAIITYRVDPKELTLSKLNSKDKLFVRDYGLALSKEILGRIWSKYDSLPASGGEKSLYKGLIEEARADMASLEEKMLAYDGPIMPVVG